MTISHLRGGVALIGTAAELATANPVVLDRQLSLETDTGVEKIGDGTTHYNSLSALPGGGGGGGTGFTDVLTLTFSVNDVVGTDGIVFTPSDLTIDAQKGTDLSVVDAAGFGGAQAVVVTASGGSFGASVVYDIRSTVQDAGSTDLRIFSMTISSSRGQTGDPYSAGMDSVTPMVLNTTITDMQTAQPFIDAAPGDWLGGQLAGFQQNGAAGDRFNLIGTFMFWRIA